MKVQIWKRSGYPTMSSPGQVVVSMVFKMPNWSTKRFQKKTSEIKLKNEILDISDPNKEDENLIMIGGIAGEEVRKFGQNLKSFSEWKKEVKRVLKT